MNATVGVAQLRQNLSTYLRRVEKGERLTVTDRNKPIAELGPPAVGPSPIDALVAAGLVAPPRHRGLPQTLPMTGDPYALSRALEAVRDER